MGIGKSINDNVRVIMYSVVVAPVDILIPYPIYYFTTVKLRNKVSQSIEPIAWKEFNITIKE